MPHRGRPFDRVDWTRVRIYDGGARGSRQVVRRAVLLLSGDRAVALGNAVFLPDRSCGDVAVLAHELTHCAQYQAWGAGRYFLRGAAAQARDLLYRTLGIGGSPYTYSLDTKKPLHAYGMEQQAQIVEDQVRRAVLRCAPAPPTAPTHSHRDRQSSP